MGTLTEQEVAGKLYHPGMSFIAGVLSVFSWNVAIKVPECADGLFSFTLDPYFLTLAMSSSPPVINMEGKAFELSTGRGETTSNPIGSGKSW